jgi:hypothetical protein
VSRGSGGRGGPKPSARSSSSSVAQAQAWLDLRVTECARSTALLRDRLWRPVECDIIQEAITARGWLRRFAAVGPLQLNVSGLPLAGMHGWRLSPGHVLVTRALRQDPDAYREWLLPVVAELLRSRPARDTNSAPPPR